MLKQLHEFLPFGLAFASTDELDNWLQHDPRWAAWTRYTYAGHARAFFQWAAGRYLADDPSVGMARPRMPRCVPRPVDDAELAHALHVAREPWRTAIMLAAYGGLRVSEIVGVRREHVTETRIRIVDAKGGDEGTVDTHEKIWQLVQGRPRGQLTQLRCGRPATRQYFSTSQRRYFDSIGLPEVTMHRFRHWFGTTLLDGGADLRTVQEALRHKRITSTEGYTRVRGGQRRLAIRSLPDPSQTPDEN